MNIYVRKCFLISALFSDINIHKTGPLMTLNIDPGLKCDPAGTEYVVRTQNVMTSSPIDYTNA